MSEQLAPIEDINEKGERYQSYSELRLGQIDPDVEGSAERWNQSRLRRVGRALRGIVNNEVAAQNDADQTAALRQKIAEGSAHQSASVQQVVESKMEVPAAAPTEATPQPPVEASMEVPQPGKPER